MCGIAGIWQLDGRPIDPTNLDRFTDALAHRGPDGRGTWIDSEARIGLGHRRLAILDLSDDGRQPMSYGDGRWWMVFNGEVFNFLELRRELEGKGHSFRTQADTEVVLASWAEWGPAALDRFNGMFAFALWDRAERRLVLARDRFGIKPMLYSHRPGGRLAFASELKAFRALEGGGMTIDLTAAAHLLHEPFGLEATETTLLAGVQRVPGGHYLTVDGGGARLTRWWRTVDHLPEVPATLPAQAQRFWELFHDSVGLRMRSDVPVGTCLSGGFDSSAIVCTLAGVGGSGERSAPDWQRTFVATFPGAVNDERAEAEKVIARSGVRGTFLPITEQDAVPVLDRVLRDLDDIYLVPPSAIWLLYQKVRAEGVVVTLDGHGADELMGAYKSEAALAMMDAPSLWAHPLRNLALVRAQMAALPSGLAPEGPRAALTWGARLLASHHPGLARIRPALRRLRRRSGDPSMGGGGHFLRGMTETFPRAAAAEDELPREWGEVNRTLYRMFHVNQLPTILRNFDRMSMAHGIEVRMPFMDWRLVSYVMALPDASKVGGGWTKRVAREAMKGRMPEAIRAAKRKVGFNSPLPEWLNGPLAGWVEERLRAAPLDHPVVDVPALTRYARRMAAGKEWTWWNAESVWPVLNYLWFEQRFLHSS